jgi:hypothetical protein
MTTDGIPAVLIVHELPGRVRLRLSCPPKDVEGLRAALTRHPSLRGVEFTPLSRSLLVHFDPGQISAEEIFIHVGFSLAMDYGAIPVRILAESETGELSSSVFYSGVLLAVALVRRLLGYTGPAEVRLDRLTGLGTAAAILLHAGRDLRRQGSVDPEVVTIVYLLAAFTRGNLLGSAALAWATTFGRHLFRPAVPGIELRPVRSAAGGWELVITPFAPEEPEGVKFVRLVPAVIKDAFNLHGPAHHRDLIEQVRAVSRLHRRVLEGLGRVRQGIPLRFENHMSNHWSD